MKKYIAEALGTGVLTLAVGLSISGSFPIPTPVIAALVLGLFVYTVGHISGTHINPAVTIGAWSVGKISINDAFGYIVSQVVGAGAALLFMSSYATMPTVGVEETFAVALAECVGMFFFAFGIASVVFGRVHGHASGLVIGGSLLLGIAIAALIGSNGMLNPAVAFGVGSFGIMYVIGPVVGSVLGMQLYRYLQA